MMKYFCFFSITELSKEVTRLQEEQKLNERKIETYEIELNVSGLFICEIFFESLSVNVLFNA